MYDVIIAGAGIAGSYLANLLRLNVLVIEKNKSIQPKDSGIVSPRIKEFFRFSSLEGISRMDLVSPSGQRIALSSEKPFAYIIESEKLLGFLRSSAAKRAEIVYDTVLGVAVHSDHVEVKTTQGAYTARMVVGADGAHSAVARSLNIKPTIAYGIMSRADVKCSNIEVIFNKYYSPDFFAWKIPAREYGVVTSVRPSEYFSYFCSRESLPAAEIVSSAIPVGMTRSYAERAILLGDACGMTKPLTCGGIIFSLSGARIASNAIKAAFEESRFDAKFLRLYEMAWRSVLARELSRQLFIRKMYRKLANKDIEKAFLDFGPSIEAMHEFDYDMLSRSWKKMPKMKLFAFLLSALFSRRYFSY